MSCDGDQAAAHRAFLISFANGRQWGNGAIIAPDAAIDDGYLDVVVVSAQTKATVLRALPRLFSGTVDRAPGVQIRRVEHAREVHGARDDDDQQRQRHRQFNECASAFRVLPRSSAHRHSASETVRMGEPP